MRVLLSTAACALLLFLVSCSGEKRGWKTYDGRTIQADAVRFDFAGKTVILENRETGERNRFSSRDLDFESKRRLLFSPVFHQSYPSEGWWIREKWNLVGLAVLSPVALLLVGMWLSGLFIARKFNPFSAAGAFIGSWIAGAILIVCYMVFAAKSNLGEGLIWLGMVIASAVMALFVSAVYQTSFVRGFFVFAGHLFFAGLLAFLLFFGADTLLPRDEVARFWENFVFAPTGLVEGARRGY